MALSQSLFSARQYPNSTHSRAWTLHTRAATPPRVWVRRTRAKVLLRGCAKGLEREAWHSHLTATAEPEPSSLHQAPTHGMCMSHPSPCESSLGGQRQRRVLPAPLSRPGTYHRRFRRGDPETLGQNPSEIGGSRPVPQQPPVMQLLEGLVALVFPFTLDLKDLVGAFSKGER